MTEPRTEAVEVNRARLLEGVPHGFLGRRGGVSQGDVAGLNVGHGSGDDPALIAENRARAVAAVLPDARLVTAYQIHSPDCVIVAEPWAEEDRPKSDALVTNRPGILLGILTADCAPVLLIDREAGIVGAAHAGWRGAIAGVTDRTIEAMEELGAQAPNIVAAIGPCIAQRSYEVDEAFRNRFVTSAAENAQFFVTAGTAGHFRFDLEAYVSARLEKAGIAAVEKLGLDTCSAPDRFYSFRRATHRGEPGYGRQISVIGAV